MLDEIIKHILRIIKEWIEEIVSKVFSALNYIGWHLYSAIANPLIWSLESARNWIFGFIRIINESILTAFRNFSTALNNALNSVFSNILGAFNAIIQAFGYVRERVLDIARQITFYVNSMIEHLASGLNKLSETLANAFNEFKKTIKESVKEITDWLKDFAHKLLDLLTNAVLKLIDLFTTFIKLFEDFLKLLRELFTLKPEEVIEVVKIFQKVMLGLTEEIKT